MTVVSRLYIACQTRVGDLDRFFSHENHAAPPLLSVGGQLRIGTKADLLVVSHWRTTNQQGLLYLSNVIVPNV